MKKIYLATAYSHDDPDVRRQRFEAVNRVAARLMGQGCLVFSPISHTHPIAEAGGLPGDWKYWQKFDRSLLEWADELWIDAAEGWSRSVGVVAEARLAIELSKPIQLVYETSEGYLWTYPVGQPFYDKLDTLPLGG